MHVFDFWYVAECQKQNTSKADGVESQGQISYFLTPVKLGERWAKHLSQIFVPDLWPNHCILLTGRRSADSEIRVWIAKEVQQSNIRLLSGSPVSKQVTQLSQRDRAAEWIKFGQKGKTTFCRHYR